MPALYQVIFWFDILTIALLSASVGFGLIFYSRTRLRWLRDYLIYTVCYAAWLLFSIYFYFQAMYLAYPLEQISLTAVALRVLVSLIILYVGPLFALRIAELPVDRREWWLLSIPVAFVFGTVLVFYSTGSQRVAIVPNGVFNLYLGAFFLVAALRTAASARSTAQLPSLRLAFLPFLRFSVGAYAVLLGANIVAVFAPGAISTPIIDVGFASGFCFLWGIMTIGVFVGRFRVIGPPPLELLTAAEIPRGFVDAFELTNPESEIARDYVAGTQSETIADRRFVSPRTVEGLISSIYRKCGVTNRTELIRLVERYRL